MHTTIFTQLYLRFSSSRQVCLPSHGVPGSMGPLVVDLWRTERGMATAASGDQHPRESRRARARAGAAM
jgi:hypothetical protein